MKSKIPHFKSVVRILDNHPEFPTHTQNSYLKEKKIKWLFIISGI